MQLTDTPVPKPTDPFSKKQKFKAEDFFAEHVFFTDYNPYDSARIRKRRFWTASQANFYSLVLFNKEKIFYHEHIPHMDMESLPCFAPVLNVLHDAGLLYFCSDIVDWNEELILQFYATLHQPLNCFVLYHLVLPLKKLAASTVNLSSHIIICRC